MPGYDSGLYDDGLWDGESSVAVAPRTGGPTLADVLARSSHVAVARLTVLWPDGTVRRAFDLDQRIVLSGSVTAERRRDVRRSVSLQLANRDGTLSPALADDLFAQGSPVRVERGAIVDGVPVYIPLMEGFVTFCTASYPDATIDLTAEGYMSALAQDAGTGIMLAAGTFLIDALHTLWDPVLPSVAWSVESGADERALGADIPVLPTDSRLDVGLQLARDLGVEAFDDRVGRIVVRLRPDPVTQPTARVMTAPLTLARTIGRLPVNAQPVEGTVGDSEPVFVLVEVEDQGSPIHRDRIGLRTAPMIQTDTTSDPDTLRATARAWLAGRALSADQLTATELPVHLDLDEGDVVERVNPMTGTSGRFVIESLDYPVGQGVISMTEQQVAPLFILDAP